MFSFFAAQLWNPLEEFESSMICENCGFEFPASYVPAADCHVQDADINLAAKDDFFALMYLNALTYAVTIAYFIARVIPTARIGTPIVTKMRPNSIRSGARGCRGSS